MFSAPLAVERMLRYASMTELPRSYVVRSVVAVGPQFVEDNTKHTYVRSLDFYPCVCYFGRYYLLVKNHVQETVLNGGNTKGACATVPRSKAPLGPSDTPPPEDPGEHK